MIVSENGYICGQNRNSNNKNNKQQETPALPSVSETKEETIANMEPSGQTIKTAGYRV